ncbi:D-amino-acid transaminase [Ancylobacter dichloromethanicus]|uniref:Probable branched-chain-amino-acid aminotransferase n=1 Tax=Ancylobacter dichloromethanicus TaxID=518825 RepID=A0A9W6J837_9HYPH|nr:D-amino-acid transaminase [Ancylobacter dichloromethanicus]MBS7554353.1 D-amino-acid transaminase [Ancylobacter dichloromethanicus]GLK71478.1 D-amino-acid transaminase [Ancylobacter dichloromethanicus]
MSRIAYVNGAYLPHADAGVHVEDRGYQFGDGVYEVCEVRAGHMVDERRHLERLVRSLNELRIRLPMPLAALGVVLRETIRRNRVRNGLVYLQVTRGVARRDHYFPDPATPPSLVVTARSVDPARADAVAGEGIAVITVPDNRWERVDIKTIGLLPNVLAKQAAKQAGAREAWFVDASGHVTEGGSTNAWIVTGDGRLVTRPAEGGILRGITRTVMLEVAEALQLRVDERPFTVAEARAAREAFVTSATNLATAVVRIDGHLIGDGRPGAVARALRENFHKYAQTGR